MQQTAQTLKSRLENTTRICILGIGSELRGDDIAGVLVAEHIQKSAKARSAKRKSPKRPLKVLNGGTAPENFTGPIKEFQPDCLIIADAADFGGQPGQIKIFPSGDIGGISFCTHSLPMNIFADYILKTCKCDIITIGIQPQTLTFAAPRPSPSSTQLNF